jgi:hypothetical protein
MSLNIDNLSSADALIGGRIVTRTKQQYEGKIKVINTYYTEHLAQAFAVPVQRDDILGFFGWLIDKKHKDKPVAVSTVMGYKSALKWYYKERKVIMTPEVDQELDSVLKGYTRRVSGLKLDGKMAVFEGKYHLPFEGYRVLATLLFQYAHFNEMLFAWPFLVLQWNLIARTATVASMMMEHIGWEGDALTVSTPKHKGDQEGAKCFARHLYANPSNPAICPVLALAVLIFVRSLRHDPSSTDSTAPASYRVFDGPSSNARFSETLQRIIAAVPASDVHLLGGEKKRLGTHSVRKGGVTYSLGKINGPSVVHIFLRAGWSLGNVQDRYVFASAGGDQLTGRVLAGLPFNDASFASLPPHFDKEGTEMIRWDSILPLYSRLPDTFKQALPHLLASICYHENCLRTLLAATHPLFSSHLFASGVMAALKPHVVTGCTRCPRTGLEATGIPPHLVIANELTVVVTTTQQLREAVMSRCDQIPGQVKDVMMSNFSIEGALPVTQDFMRDVVNAAIAQLRADIRDRQAADTAAAAQPSLIPASTDPRFQLWMWGGRMHMVPQGWTLSSSVNVKDTWNLWHFGHVTARIGPLRGLKKFDLTTDAQVTLWSKTRGVMQAIAQMMVDMQLVATLQAVSTLSAAESSAFFDQAIVEWMEKLKPGSTQGRGRWMEMKIATIYALMLKTRKRSRAEMEEGGGAGQQEEGEGEQDSTAAAVLSQLGR